MFPLPLQYLRHIIFYPRIPLKVINWHEYLLANIYLLILFIVFLFCERPNIVDQDVFLPTLARNIISQA